MQDIKIWLERFTLEDLPQLEEIMALNQDSAGDRQKDWSKFIQWNVENIDDPYWKIMMRFHQNGKDYTFFTGYIGYAQASRKPTTRQVSQPQDLFLEIYLHPDFTGQGIGEEAYNQSLLKIPKAARKIYASTYMSNTRAQGFFVKKLGMKVSHYDKRFNVVVYVAELYA